jgi:hypothetical protein
MPNPFLSPKSHGTKNLHALFQMPFDTFLSLFDLISQNFFELQVKRTTCIWLNASCRPARSLVGLELKLETHELNE